MQRRYTASMYEELIYKVKETIPEAGIGVDVIVGFPGESEEDFIHTHNLLRDLPISYLHVFTYSERPDTKAISLPCKVDVYERKRRNNILRILSEKKRKRFYEDMIRKNQEVLFESHNKEGMMQGFTSNYMRIKTDFNEALTNQFCIVEVTSQEKDYCLGNILYTKNSVDLVHPLA
jgi:threonylcarbamoyladenosine tRNA methylthiotransferase MtaB